MRKGSRVTEKNESQNISGGGDCVPMKCVLCSKDNVSMFKCKSCRSGCYCSKECQMKCWLEHKPICESIVTLETQNKERAFANLNFVSKLKLTPKEEIKLVNLVGRKCTLNCQLDNVESEVLWDTGAEVALVSQSWLDENLPGKEIKNVSELLGHDLFLQVANNSKLDYLGYTEITFQMCDGAELLMVPFLVTEEEVTLPIIGYNVIEEIVKEETQKRKPNLVAMIEASLTKVSKKKVEALVSLIQKKVSGAEPESLGDVIIGKKDVVIPKGRSMVMKCFTHCGPVNGVQPV